MNPYADLINASESQNGLPSGFLTATIQQESSFNPNAVNGSAVGLAQFMPGTAQQYGVNPLDPASSISGAGQYLRDLFGQTGSWVTASQRYGTLPQDLSNLTPGQQNVYNIAAAADAQNAGGYNLLSGNDTAFPANGPIATLGNTIAAGKQAGALIGSMTKPGFFSGIAIRIGVGVLAIILVGLGAAALALKSGPGKIIVNTVGKVAA